jgi:hypothetical protein
MFSSLDRADIVLKPTDGRKQYVQTDHRTPEEMEEEPELSVLFALVRVLNPKRMAEKGEPEPVVLYEAMHRPPDFLCRAIRAAGGRLSVGRNPQPVPDAGTPPLEEVIESAFTGLAPRVAAEHGVELSLTGLEVVERNLAGTAPDAEEDEFAYWSAVLKLGTFAGELIRAAKGGRWVVVDTGTLPLALTTTYEGSEATVNPLGKAVKRFANGEEDSVAFMVELIRRRP